MTQALETDKVAAARLWAVSRLPYLASAVFGCVVRAAPGSGTVAIDARWRVHADPTVVAGLDVPGLGALLVHLASHVLRDHAGRAVPLALPDHELPRWLRCADAEINDDLAAARCLPPVANTVPADLDQPDGGLVETYYAAVPAGTQQVTAGQWWDCGSGGDGVARPWDGPAEDGQQGLTGMQADRLRHAVAAAVRDQHAQQPGSVAGGWLRWAQGVLPSRTDWRRELAAEIRRATAMISGSVDYTYRRPSRRAAGAVQGDRRVVLPSLYRPRPSVAVVCDTSGSMDDDLLSRALTEIEAILTRAGLRASGLPVLSVDTQVHAVGLVTRAAQVHLAGGGGTDMGAGIEAAVGLRPRPELVVVLTDGYTPWPDEPPRGVRVVVGVLADSADTAPPIPPWARGVVISQ